MTLGVSKQLLPVYDKPLVHYPLATLMLAGIRDILLITTPQDLVNFQRLLGDGTQLGIQLSYTVQARPEGLAQAFLLGETFIGSDSVALALGDNVFYGHEFPESLRRTRTQTQGATVFAYRVRDPKRYGVVEFDAQGVAINIEEKPDQPRSSYAVTGLYFYDNQVVEIAKSLRPSPRGELEITDVNRIYLQNRQLKVEKLGRGIAWLDTGTPEALLQASNFIQAIEDRQGLKVCCVEEVAYQMGFIDAAQLEELATAMRNNYGHYLKHLLMERP
jgi:glucose-1-phosphate thymidylyltransferase